MSRISTRIGRALLSLLVVAGPAVAEDIDVFVGSAGPDSALPNVIFVLDNTSNWSRQAQKWPGGLAQGQSEVRAIKRSLGNLVDEVNVGLVEFTTEGNANEDGGYVRFNLQKFTAESQKELNTKLTTIENKVQDPSEKRNSNTPYGDLMYDVYNYLAGAEQSDKGAGTPTSLADSSAYTTAYSRFKSPLTSSNLCTNTYLIFIGNPDQSGPVTDTSSNTSALQALYASVGATPDGLAGTSGKAPLPIPGFSVTTVTEPSTKLGDSAQCYKDTEIASCTVTESNTSGLCANKTDCACSATKSSNTAGCVTTGNQANRTARREVIQGGGTSTVVTPNGSANNTIGRAWNFDDWAKFLNDYGVPVAAADDSEQPRRVPVVTYAIDVFNKQQNAEQTGLMLSASEGVGGGHYFAAKNEDAIVNAINSALSDILSVSSTFAAVTLPLSATNRAQQENQVFIGMFRPDKEALPRWFGNLKRYQIALFNGKPELADVNFDQAINPITGFAAECADSFWGTDSGSYWSGLGITPQPRSQCVDVANTDQAWSDLPDGPFVEKGGAAQVTRKSDLSQRNILTVGAAATGGAETLVAMNSSTALGSQTLLDYLYGKAPGKDEKADANGVRPSLHGDVIHSRPLAINYGEGKDVYVYYGANDGLLRSIKAEEGAEQWSFIAPEHYSKIQRLYDNSPKVAFPNQSSTATPAPQPKTYFFDGSIGQIVNYNDENVADLAYIYPSMRRGGRMVYAFDVTDPVSPALLWRFGCPNLTNNDSCTTGYETIGQTWSTPIGGFIAAESGDKSSVVMFGGGYDNCLDSDVANYPCGSSVNGKGIYVLDAQGGTVLAGPTKLPTDAPVVADLATVDMNFDGVIDFAYATDAAGGIYRISFASLDANGAVTPLASTSWKIEKVANTLDKTRRFLNQPSVAVFKNNVYVAIGSGNRERPLESNYPFASQVQDRFYVFVDSPGVASSEAVDLDGSLLGNVTPTGSSLSGQCTTKGQRGWFMNLQGRGEQVVNPAAIAGGQVLFNSYRPGGDTANLCSRPLGIATGYSRSLFNPSSCDKDTSTDIPGGGMPIPPIITVVPVTDKDGQNEEIVTVCIGCEGLNPNEIVPDTDQSRRRIYWNSDVDR